MALVKFETNDSLDMELKSIQMARPNCNTNAAAAKHAIENYLSVEEELNEVKKKLEQSDELLRKIHTHYRQISLSKQMLEHAINQI